MKLAMSLEKIVKKAVVGGWRYHSWKGYPKDIDEFANWLVRTGRVRTVLFDRKFIKAIVGKGKQPEFVCYVKGYECVPGGDKPVLGVCRHGNQVTNKTLDLERWEFHIQKLAIETDANRLKYLEQFL